MESTDHLFTLAGQFRDTYRLLSDQLTKRHSTNFIAPMNMNLACSLELYLKCIYQLENRIESPYAHHLNRLYSRLKSESKKEIETSYRNFLAQDPTIPAILNARPDIDMTINERLKVSKDSFTNWRFLHEKKLGKEYTPIGLGHILDAARLRAIRLKEQSE